MAARPRGGRLRRAAASGPRRRRGSAGNTNPRAFWTRVMNNNNPDDDLIKLSDVFPLSSRMDLDPYEVGDEVLERARVSSRRIDELGRLIRDSHEG